VNSSKNISFQRKASLALAFLLPPLLVSGLMAISTVKDVMRPREPAPVTLPAHLGDGKKPGAPHPPPPPGGWPLGDESSKTAQSSLPTVGFVLNSSGTETLSLLGAWEILARSQAFRLVTLSSSRSLVPLTGSVSVLPDYIFADAPPLDVLWVLPGVDPENMDVIGFLKSQAAKVKTIVAPAEAAQTLASAGFLEHESATSSFLTLPALASKYPGVKWDSENPFVASGRVWTSGGAGIQPELALAFLRAQTSNSIADRVNAELGSLPARQVPRPIALTPAEVVRVLLELGLGWGRTYYSIALEPGISELGLGAWLEIPARGLSSRVTSVSPRRGYVRTEHGLTLVAEEGLDDAFPPHFLVFPPNKALAALSAPTETGGLLKRVRHANFSLWEDQVRVPVLHEEDRPPPHAI